MEETKKAQKKILSLTRSSQKRPETTFLNRIIHLPPLQLAESFKTSHAVGHKKLENI